jgi:hypothetical protein
MRRAAAACRCTARLLKTLANEKVKPLRSCKQPRSGARACVAAPAPAAALLATLLSHTIPFPGVHKCVVVSLVHTSLGSSYLIAHVLHDPPPPTRTAKQ